MITCALSEYEWDVAARVYQACAEESWSHDRILALAPLQYGLSAELAAALDGSAAVKESALVAITAIASSVGKTAAPYLVTMLPALLDKAGDSKVSSSSTEHQRVSRLPAVTVAIHKSLVLFCCQHLQLVSTFMRKHLDPSCISEQKG